MRYLFFLAVSIFIIPKALFAQLAEERTAPFSGARMQGSQLMVKVEGKWYGLKAIDGTSTASIIKQCKEEDDEWLEVFSEDIVEVMQALGKPLKQTSKLTLDDNGSTITKTVAVTKENRRASWKYYNEKEEVTVATAKTNNSGTSTMKDVDRATAKAVNLDMDKPFKFKSAKIEYNVEGGKLFAGKETFYIDDYGKTVVVVIDKPGMMGQKEHKTIIWKDDKTTEIDHAKKTWQSYKIRQKITEPPVIAYSNETQRKQGGYVKQSNEKVAGNDCEVYKHAKNDVTYWLWKGIDLKIRNYSLGKNGYIRTATSVSEGVSIPASVLKVPASYTKR